MIEHPNRRIVLDATDAEYDHSLHDEEHYILFDHYPQPGPDGRCTHPMHDEMRGMIDQPGVEIELTFDPTSVISDDAAVVVDQEREYDARVAWWRDRIRLIEERQQFLDALDPKRKLRRAERRRMQRELAKINRKLGVE